MVDLATAIAGSIRILKDHGDEVDTGHWQGVPTEGKPDLVTKEIINLNWQAQMPDSVARAAVECEPNLPWAEDHFQERVSRVPSNPGEQYKNWPWWRGQDEETRIAGPTGKEPQFTHTYQERFWPKLANRRFADPWRYTEAARGIRYHYGDLDDVVTLLRKHPFTRQATFPIFFPEDTGAVHGGRIPCTLHYHFLLRNDRLHMWYPIRSCDAVRHFRDDIYMAVRLCQWVIGQCAAPAVGELHSLWDHVRPGFLHFTAYSFHVHKGDMHLL